MTDRDLMRQALEAYDKHEPLAVVMEEVRARLSLPEQNQFKPDYNTEAVLVEEMQRMAKRIEYLEAMLERQTARIVVLQTHINNFYGENR